MPFFSFPLRLWPKGIWGRWTESGYSSFFVPVSSRSGERQAKPCHACPPHDLRKISLWESGIFRSIFKDVFLFSSLFSGNALKTLLSEHWIEAFCTIRTAGKVFCLGGESVFFLFQGEARLPGLCRVNKFFYFSIIWNGNGIGSFWWWPMNAWIVFIPKFFVHF